MIIAELITQGHIGAIPDIIRQVYFNGAKSAQIVMLVGFFIGKC